MKDINLKFESTFTQLGETETISFDLKGTLEANKRFVKLHFVDNDGSKTVMRLSAKTVLIVKSGYDLYLKVGEKVDNYFQVENGNLSLTTFLENYNFAPNKDADQAEGSVSLKYSLMMAGDDAGVFSINIDYKEV